LQTCKRIEKFDCVGFDGCQFEQDPTWNITWPATEVDREATQKCPGGSEAKGKMNNQLYT